MVKAADARPVRVSAAKKLEKYCVIGRHFVRQQHALLLEYQLINKGTVSQLWHQSQERKQKRRSEDGVSPTFLPGAMDRELHPDVGSWHED
jgi:hypothetical protein